MQKFRTEIEDTCNGGVPLCSRSDGEKMSPVLDDIWCGQSDIWMVRCEGKIMIQRI